MSKPVFNIVDDFYNASWDLAENLFRLNLRAGDDNALQVNVVDPEIGDLPLTVPAVCTQFKKFADPFLKLEGRNLPQEQHLPYMEIEDCLNETVLPALDVLTELWDDVLSGGEDAQSRFDQSCIYINRTIEMVIIPQASGMAKDMKP